MLGFLKKNKEKNEKKNAAVFVDYEHWYISSEKLYCIKPNIGGWVNSVSEKFNIRELVFFGNFSSTGMQSEMSKIRGYTNKIVETNNGSNFYKKDFTDFIMLDHIYQSAFENKDIDTFIIFTGDGHFSSVALFLKNGCNKDVGVYGVRGAFSNQLKMAASWYVEMPSQNDTLYPYCCAVLSSLYALDIENKRGFPTYGKTVEAVSQKYEVARESIKAALDRLIELEYISFSEHKVGYKTIRTLSTDWQKISDDYFWQEGKNIKLPQEKVKG